MKISSVRKLTTLIAEALKKSDEVYTIEELVAALEALKVVALEMGKREHG